MMSWGQYYFLNPSSSFIENVSFFHDYVIIFLTFISFLIFFFLLSLLKLKDFNFTTFEHHQLEFLWTIAPVFLLLMIILPSLSLLYFSDSCLFCGLRLVVVGQQWYWSYFYKDLSGLIFSSYMEPSDFSLIRLLEVDNRVILPYNLPIRSLCSSRDVIHSWAIPSLGVKMDAVPGRLNQSCFTLKRRGLFFGQCSEICGINHSFIPIVLESIKSKDFFNLLV